MARGLALGVREWDCDPSSGNLRDVFGGEAFEPGAQRLSGLCRALELALGYNPVDRRRPARL